MIHRVNVPAGRACLAAFFFAIVTLALLPAGGQASVAGFEQYSFPEEAPSTQKAEPPATPAPTPYIVGGKETTWQKYPWQVEITINGSHHCGGSLIHPRVVLTAAHCVLDDQGFFYANYTTFQAFTGRTMTDTGGEQLVLRNAFVPNDYKAGALPHDYAFVTLDSSSSRARIKIAGPNEGSTWKPGRMLVASGYGLIVEKGAGSPILKEVRMPRIADSVCAGPDVYFTAFQQQVMMCAGSMAGGQSTCQGDSGGPLMAPIDGGYRLVGVVSWAEGCARPNRPTVFTRVADPAYGKVISDGLKSIASQADPGGFPGTDSAIDVLGSGAKPAGCSAARKQANAAKKQAGKAATAARKARKAAGKAKQRVRKARGAARARAKQGLKRANKKLQSANRKSKAAKKKSSAAAQKAKKAC